MNKKFCTIVLVALFCVVSTSFTMNEGLGAKVSKIGHALSKTVVDNSLFTFAGLYCLYFDRTKIKDNAFVVGAIGACI